MDYSKIPKRAKIIFKAIVGSRAFGTDTKKSDSDIKGVYMQHPDDILGFNQYQKHAVVGPDETYYEIGRFIELLSEGNPSAMELLFSPDDCILVQESEFDIMRLNRNSFITKGCIFSFAHYAMSQFGKAVKHNRHRKKKNLLHCRRLLDMAIEIGETGKLEVRRSNRDYLLSIKDGSTDFNSVKEGADKDLKKVDTLAKKSKLQKEVNVDLCNMLLLSVRNFND